MENMAIFANTLIKSLAIFISFLLIIVVTTSFLSLLNNQNKSDFVFTSGNKNSTNIIAIIELNGVIINNNTKLNGLTNSFVISPNEVKKYLEELNNISPKVIIFAINSPGGTVSASKHLYEVINKFKKNNNAEIFFHSDELLASGGYWAATSADKIYANYGSIIGSIGVKGPDWFFYDQPYSISTGIFGNRVETKKNIKKFSNTAGNSKDLFNPFREPSVVELKHLQNMVDEIYNEFVRVVSSARKIETDTIIKDIGALIYTAGQAKNINLIDAQINLSNLIAKTIQDREFIEYKIIKKFNDNSLIEEIFSGNLFKSNISLNYNCISLRNSISTILSYESIGC